MGEGTSIINFGELSKPATVLIEKISDAVGGAFKPFQITRVAKAEAEASLIHAQTEIRITELHKRAIHRFIDEEAKKQANIEAITENAIPQLEDKAEPQKMEDDWITNFFDKCRIVSDEEMQKLWGKVLAGEANNPGTYSKRTVSFIGSLDKLDALLFSKVCGFCWILGNALPVVLDADHAIYNDQGVNFGVLTHLDAIGLVKFENISGFRRVRLPKRIRLAYDRNLIDLDFTKDTENSLTIGKILFTQIGQQLAPICGSKPVDGFVDYVIGRWLNDGHVMCSPWPRAENGWNLKTGHPEF